MLQQSARREKADKNVSFQAAISAKCRLYMFLSHSILGEISGYPSLPYLKHLPVTHMHTLVHPSSPPLNMCQINIIKTWQRWLPCVSGKHHNSSLASKVIKLRACV